ncbi:SubName: Full=Uncharacterized protein {ECO:0000313/EMBL:CCA71957.1} [Serendipita indica DSM 11827]|uniref:Uncharacterized protein n=1 Tax=Serendipita indica (strain DSM 11827) TaxID=1109443 RepID=G4TKW4_SERID|nr:SubName: Full=Uncharacterized protein {ECO:0000313/EMBL:CCA71957.1} [Serendipita indica DSM 11827]CCA71957.1 hypothetical protein PIIN_05892 [Serendipita indica DSM 11827]
MFVKLVATFALATAGANAAVRQAICSSHGMFLNTESGHTPCDIGALLVGGGIKPADSPFPDLISQGLDRYPAPSANEADDLRCNPIFYNLASACGACQASTLNWTTWAEWTVNCKSVTSPAYVIERMPADIPIPGWAFVPPAITNGTFDKFSALTESAATIPDSYFPKLVVTAITVCDSPKLTPSQLAGAIVGGLVGLGTLILIAAFIFLRRTQAARSVVGGFGRASTSSSADSIMRQKATT